MNDGGELIHGSCVALGRHAALLRGPSGSGKSDLALRFVLETPPSLGAALVADDQVLISLRGPGELMVRAPATIAGRIEVRGIGIVALPFREEAMLALVVDLVPPKRVPRLPEGKEQVEFLGVSRPVLRLAPFEASAPLKLRLALQSQIHDLEQKTD